MKKKNFYSVISVILSVIMVFSCFSMLGGALPTVFASVTRDGEEHTVVIACSDYQYCNSPSDNGGSGGSYDVYEIGAYGNDGSKLVVQTILDVMEDTNGIDNADGFLFAGDYSYNMAGGTPTGLTSLKEAISGVITPTADNSVFIQGNHDSEIGTNGMSPSGNNDPSSGEYGVFVINEDDYPWQGSSSAAENTVKETAQNLRDYLNSKIAVGYTAPVFVISHLPLHYSMRSQRDGDNKYANYIFDVLNDAGDKGLNIIFLYGHNHSHGWDDYLGGAQVFLAKGDTINIAQKSQTVYNEETLNFTYMNAGYVGYYQNTNNNAPSIDLTMTSFEISDDEVEITRYSLLNEDKTALKVAGRMNTEASYNTGEGSQRAANTGNSFAANTTTYPSSYTLSLGEVTDTEYEIPRVIPLASDSGSGAETSSTVYTKVNSVSEITSGDKYLIISSDTDFMTPEDSGHTDRIGFALESTNGLTLSDTIVGNYGAYEWRLDSSNGKWMLGDGENVVSLSRNASSSSSYDAQLASSGSSFTVSGSGSSFNFSSSVGGTTVNLNRNSQRNLINGYTSNPENFSIYKVTGTSAVGERKYVKVISKSELVSGEKYLLINKGTDFMTDELNGHSENGFLLESTNGLVLGNQITGDFEAYEWQMDETGGKWTLSTENGSAKITKDGAWWDSSLVSTGASQFTVSGSGESFNFSTTNGTDTAVLNNNGINHGIGGYADDATPFAIYRFDGSTTDKYTKGKDGYYVYTPAVTGQILAEGDYILYGNAKGTVLTSADHSQKGLNGSTDYEMIGNKIVSDAACTVNITVADASANTYYFKVGDKYIIFGGSDNQDIQLSSTKTALKVTASSSYPGVVAISNSSGSQYVDTYGNTQWAGWSDGISNANERITLYKRQFVPDNGTWIPVHETVTTVPDTYTYSLPGNGKYALVGANGILKATASGTSQDSSVTGKPSGEQTIWELTNEAGGYTLKTTVNGTTYYLNNNGGLSASKQYVTLTADASNKVTIGNMGGFAVYPVTVTEKAGSATYVYTLDTNGIDANEDYLIVGGSNAYAFTHAGTTVNSTSVTINTNNNTITTNTDAYEWQFSGSSSGNIFDPNSEDDYYLGNSTGTVQIKNTATTYNFARVGTASNGRYRIVNPMIISNKYYYLRYNGSWNMANDNSNNSSKYYVRLYKLTSENVQPGETTYTYSNAWTTTATKIPGSTISVIDQWAMLEPGYAIEVGLDTDAEMLAAQILASDEFNAFLGYSSSGANAVTLPSSGITFDTSAYNSAKTGLYEVPVYYNGICIGYTVVKVLADKKISSISLDKLEGTVLVGAAKGANTGAYFTVTYEDGTTGEIPITVGMLIDRTGNFDCANLYCKEVGDYPGLGVYYKDNWFSGFTLHVKERDNYPEYPDEGSIRVDKKAWADNFSANGVAKVELTATGVPMDPGIDIAIILDTSSSMGYTMGKYEGRDVFGDGNNHWFEDDGSPINGIGDSDVSDQVSRLSVMQNSLRKLLDDLNVQGANGRTRDINVAIADFNGYTLEFTGGKEIDKLSVVNQSGSNTDKSKVFTGSCELDAEAFVQASTLDSAHFDVTSITKANGTNYDKAMENAYQLLAAKKAENDANQENRTLYCIFMSDGAPFQFNYFGGNSAPETNNPWNEWITGAYEDISGFNVPENCVHQYFYNGLGNKHRLAEAIKGSPESSFEVIRPDPSLYLNGQQYMTEVDGIGAKMYSIGFCLTPDKGITTDSMHTVLTDMATAPEFYYPANSADQLNDTFNSILNDLKQAATEAYFVDNMGVAFDLQMASEYTKNGQRYTLDPAPVIEVKSYDVHTHMDFVRGVITDENRIGERKGTYTVLESVSFNTAGTEAYSNLHEPGINILADGLINAETFVYNTTGEAVMIDTDGDGEEDYSLAPETFYWKIGIVAETEFALSYYVYLTGSMEGTREAGSYATNDAAILYYMNYLDVPCEKPTVSPKLPWLAASVSYEFYLVNSDGQPVNSSGVPVPFANRVLIGNTQTKEVLLNNTDTTTAFVAANLELPEGYTLYSDNATYTVVIDSDTVNSHATISDTETLKNKETVTTYFYDEKGNWNTAGTVPNVSDYGNTHVAFGVLLIPSLIPDAVVIDYGLPVNISVLANDLYISVGTEINGMARETAADTVLNTQYYDASRITGEKTLTLNSGTAEISGGVIRYTPSSAIMQEQETFYYEVILAGKYYYSTVTVYPAQNIFYEDSFFTFTPEDKWETDGTLYTDKYQAEDRPGDFNLSKIDFNNVYGYDAAYEDEKAITHSLGTARKITVDSTTPKATAANAPNAVFTFAGTGFDLFSVTSASTGAAMVEVWSSAGTRLKNFYSQSYYGFTYNESEDKFVPASSGDDGLFQVPVIRCRDLAYDVYTVKVIPTYNKLFDMKKTGSYDFYVDGIRIYDPAGVTPADDITDIYKKDNEADSHYIELRSNIISSADFYNLDGTPASITAFESFAPGAMYIDGISALTSDDYSAALAKFMDNGPNNEIYLSKGQAIAFYLQIENCIKTPASLQLGMKVVGGSDANGSVLVMSSQQDKPTFVSVKGAAERYYDLTNAFTWDKELLGSTEKTGFKLSDPFVCLGKATLTDGEDKLLSLNEFTFEKNGEKWFIKNGSDKMVLAITENCIKGTYGPNGTGDMFTVTSADGLFTFSTDKVSADSTAKVYLGYDAVISGTKFGAASFYVYASNGDGTYSKVNSAEELVSGKNYVLICKGTGTENIVTKTVGKVDKGTYTYKTLYPIVIMNNSDDLLSLTSFKCTFNDIPAKPVSNSAPLMSMVSSRFARDFALDAISSYVLDPDYTDTPEVSTDNISISWDNENPDFGDTATLMVRAPENIAGVEIDGVLMTDVTDNGDGTKTWTYSFTVTEDSSGNYSIVLLDENGNVSKTISAGKLELPETTTEETTVTTVPDEDPSGTGEEITTAPSGTTEQDDSHGGGSKFSFLDLIRTIIEFFKSVIRWWKSLL